jgi:exopolysaccharide biosynthesis polyprenyl glycosylphosphotransferase
MNNKLKKIILLFGDIIILYAALYFALWLRYGEMPSGQDWQIHSQSFSIIFLFWLLIFYISDLYNLYLAINNARFFYISLRAIGISGLLSIAYFYLNPQIGISPKTNLAIFLIVFTVFFIVWRQFFNWLLTARLPKNKIVIIGFNNQVKELAQALNENPHLGYQIVAIISEQPVNLDNNDNITVTDNINKLNTLIKQKKISTVVLTSNLHQSPTLRTVLLKCLPLKINIINLPNFYEAITGRVPIEAISEMWFLENLSEGNKRWFGTFKRFYDIILALIILIITAPFWPLIGLIIKLESRGSIFFRQKRVGRDNKIFTIIKFRTMVTENNNQTPTKIGDARITRFGRFLRKTRLDEIPQVLNILAGDMSFVGPRPERPDLVKELEKYVPFYRERTLVKPGLTGPDQISGEYHSPSREDTFKKLQYDLFYIKNRSIYLDLSIILKTIATVLSRGGR